MIEPLLTLLIGIVLILAIIAANGYFVAQEFAFMSVDRTRLAARAAEGDRAAARALRVTKRTTFMLSGAQLGITVRLWARAAGRRGQVAGFRVQSRSSRITRRRFVGWLASAKPAARNGPTGPTLSSSHVTSAPPVSIG